MRYFNAQRRPSDLADADFQGLIQAHQAVVRNAQGYQAGDEQRHRLGLTLATLGGAGTLGTSVAIGLGALSATVLPVVLPITVAVGLGGLASMVINRLSTDHARTQQADAQDALQALSQEAQRRGLNVAVPSRGALGARIDARDAGVDGSGPALAPSVRRPGVA